MKNKMEDYLSKDGTEFKLIKAKNSSSSDTLDINDLKEMKTVFENNKNIKKVVLSNVAISNGLFYRISLIIKNNTDIEYLEFDNVNTFGKDTIVEIFPSLENKNIKVLKINNCFISSLNSINGLKSLPKIMKTLKHLDLSNSSFHKLIENISEALETNTTLEYLDIGSTLLPAVYADEVKHINKFLEHNMIITHLGLRGAVINDKIDNNSSKLFEILANHKSIESLNLAGTKIEQHSYGEFAKVSCLKFINMLKSNKLLQYIDLGYIWFNNNGLWIKQVLEALKDKPLKHLSLKGCKIKDDDYNVLATLIEKENIESLNLASNSMTDKDLKQIAKAIENNQGIKRLDLSTNNFSNSEGILGKVLKNNNYIKEVKLSGFNLSLEGIRDLVVLSMNHINHVKDENNFQIHIDPSGMKPIYTSLKVKEIALRDKIEEKIELLKIIDYNINRYSYNEQTANQLVHDILFGDDDITEINFIRLDIHVRNLVNQKLLEKSKETFVEKIDTLKINNILKALSSINDLTTFKELLLTADSTFKDKTLEKIYNQLKELDLLNFRLDHETNLKILNECLNEDTKTIVVKEEPIGMQYILEFINKNPNIENIEIIDCQISDFDTKLLAEFLAINKTIKSIKIIDEEISAIATKLIANAIDHNTTLESLVLYIPERIDNRDVLYKALYNNQYINSIDLGMNTPWKEWLESRENMTILSLPDNGNVRHGLDQVFSFLENNHTITKVDLSNCDISYDNFHGAKNFLMKNFTVKEIILSGDNFYLQMKNVIEDIILKSMQYNVTITKFTLDCLDNYLKQKLQLQKIIEHNVASEEAIIPFERILLSVNFDQSLNGDKLSPRAKKLLQYNLSKKAPTSLINLTIEQIDKLYMDHYKETPKDYNFEFLKAKYLEYTNNANFVNNIFTNYANFVTALKKIIIPIIEKQNEQNSSLAFIMSSIKIEKESDLNALSPIDFVLQEICGDKKINISQLQNEKDKANLYAFYKMMPSNSCLKKYFEINDEENIISLEDQKLFIYEYLNKDYESDIAKQKINISFDILEEHQVNNEVNNSSLQPIEVNDCSFLGDSDNSSIEDV